MDKVEFLRGTSLFGSLTDAELRDVIARLKVGRYEPDEVIFLEGDAADAAYIVLEGAVELTKTVSADVERAIATAGPGEVFGEMGMLEREPRSATARARGAVEAVWIGAELFHELLEAQPAIGAKVLGQMTRLLSARLRTTTALYAEAVRWGIETSGATRLGWHDLVEDWRRLTFGLRGGRSVAGRLLRADVTDGREDLVVQTVEGPVMVIPYHAVEYVALDEAAAQASEGV